MNTQRVAVDFINDLLDKYGEDITVSITPTEEHKFAIEAECNAENAEFDMFDEDEIVYLIENFNFRHIDHNVSARCVGWSRKDISFDVAWGIHRSDP